MDSNNNRYAIILSGGSGTRLWPLSRSLRPKQLLNLNGEESLIQQTAKRLLERIDAPRILTVTHVDHKFDVKGQLGEISHHLAENVLSEPIARNTLPAIAWATYEISKSNPEAIVSVFPSDHAIGNVDAFGQAWECAEICAEEGFLTLIGIKPTMPSTGYGYIEPGAPLKKHQNHPRYLVNKFIEKPDAETAAELVGSGYLWNGGMFVFRADSFLSLVKKHQPLIYKLIHEIDSVDIAHVYSEMPSLSIDYGIAEKEEKIAVVPADMDWSDLGNWDSVYLKHSPNGSINVKHGDVIDIDTNQSLIWADHGLVATLGISNIAIIQTADVTLVCSRDRTEDIKQLVSTVQKSHPQLTESHLTVHRPWGTYTVLEEGVGFKIKRIVVKPGCKLSLQLHHHRSEHWVVVSGMAKVSNGSDDQFVNVNESTYIPAGHKHRLENPGLIDLVIIEIQSGQYLGEDDIVRFDDTYGRQ